MKDHEFFRSYRDRGWPFYEAMEAFYGREPASSPYVYDPTVASNRTFIPPPVRGVWTDKAPPALPSRSIPRRQLESPVSMIRSLSEPGESSDVQELQIVKKESEPAFPTVEKMSSCIANLPRALRSAKLPVAKQLDLALAMETLETPNNNVVTFFSLARQLRRLEEEVAWTKPGDTRRARATIQLTQELLEKSAKQAWKDLTKHQPGSSNSLNE